MNDQEYGGWIDRFGSEMPHSRQIQNSLDTIARYGWIHGLGESHDVGYFAKSYHTGTCLLFLLGSPSYQLLRLFIAHVCILNSDTILACQ